MIDKKRDNVLLVIFSPRRETMRRIWFIVNFSSIGIIWSEKSSCHGEVMVSMSKDTVQIYSPALYKEKKFSYLLLLLWKLFSGVLSMFLHLSSNNTQHFLKNDVSHLHRAQWPREGSRVWGGVCIHTFVAAASHIILITVDVKRTWFLSHISMTTHIILEFLLDCYAVSMDTRPLKFKEPHLKRFSRKLSPPSWISGDTATRTRYHVMRTYC